METGMNMEFLKTNKQPASIIGAGFFGEKIIYYAKNL